MTDPLTNESLFPGARPWEPTWAEQILTDRHGAPGAFAGVRLAKRLLEESGRARQLRILKGCARDAETLAERHWRQHYGSQPHGRAWRKVQPDPELPRAVLIEVLLLPVGERPPP